MGKLCIFRWSRLVVKPSPRFRLARNLRCSKGCATYPTRCQHARGWHVVAFGLVVMVG